MRAWVLLVLAACGRIDFDPLAGAQSGWYDPAWKFRLPLTIDHTKVAGDLADFPVLVQIDSPALNADGNGFYLFVGSDGQPLSFELDHDAAHPQRLLAWVRVPELSASADTALYLYFDGPASTEPTNTAAPWTNGYKGVYHLGDGSTLSVGDSTTLNPATNNRGTAAAGKIGGAASFDGMSNIVSSTAGLDTAAGTVDTVTFWLYFDPTFDRGPVTFTDASDTVVYDLWFQTDGCEGFNTGNGEALATSATGLASRWVYVAAMFLNGTPTYAPASGTGNQLFFDGVPQPLSFSCSPGTPSAVTIPALLDWGGNVHGAANYRIVGQIDEARVATGARSQAWIMTEYVNQSDPTAFVVVGSEEMY